MELDDGGQAFPRPHYAGMSLRDWFAGQALAGMSNYPIGMIDYAEAVDSVVEVSYRIADAMLAARNKEQQ